MTDADNPAFPPDSNDGAQGEFPAPAENTPNIDQIFPTIPQGEIPPAPEAANDAPPAEVPSDAPSADSSDAEAADAPPTAEHGEMMDSFDALPEDVSAIESHPADGSEEDDTSNEPTSPTAVVRYGLMGFLGEFRYNTKHNVRAGKKVVIRTDRGVELGDVVSLVDRNSSSNTQDECQCSSCPTLRITPEALNNFLQNSSENYPFRRGGRILRVANPQDLIDFRHLSSSASEESKYCRDQIKQRNLPMRLVTAEHMLGGERIVFYFTAESRVDFRNLVRDLASQFRTRIEMRQVGARDEARLVADYERCGRHCCCKEFLKDLKPVSMRMAKVQKATLDPTKISGRCGRLMCCLRYEDECYEELKKSLPKRNTWIRTKTHIGCVVDGQIITQLVRIALYDGTFISVPVEDILERNITPPSEEELRDHAVKQAALQRSEARKAAEAESLAILTPPVRREEPAESADEIEDTDLPEEPMSGESAAVEGPADDGSPASGDVRKKRRRRRRRKPSGDPNAPQNQGGQGGQNNNAPNPQRQQGNQQRPRRDNAQAGNNAPNSQNQGEGRSGKRRRGRRRRRKPGQGGGEGSQGGGGGNNPPPSSPAGEG